MKATPGGIVHLTFIFIGGIIGVVFVGVISFNIILIIENQFGTTVGKFVWPWLIISSSFLGLFAGIWLGNRIALSSRNSAEIVDNAIHEERLVVHTSKSELIGHFIFIGFCFACPIITLIMGLTPIDVQVFFCLFGPLLGSIIYYSVSPSNLLTKEPQLIIDEKGITNSRWRHQFIPWAEIQQIKQEIGYRNSKHIVIILENSQANHQNSLEKHSTRSKNSIRLNVSGLNKSKDEIWRFLCSFRESSSLIFFKKVPYQDKNRNSSDSNYFRISNEMNEQSLQYKSGDKVVWCRQKFADDSYWGTKAIVLGLTEKRVKIEIMENDQLQTKNVMAKNLVPRQFVLWGHE